jgi:hypothetical protein
MIKLLKALTAITLAFAFLNLANTQETLQLTGDFVGTVRLGPDAGTVWQGLLILNVAANGEITGTLKDSTGTLKVSGTVTGQSITLVFDLGDSKYVIGTGGLNKDVRNNPTIMGGTLSGPNEGDIGDWGYGIGG